MLAYVFWHWQDVSSQRQAYEEYLVAFHQTLQTAKPAGFQFSMVLQTNKLPWIDGETVAYEDWYLLENSAALDRLDEAAVNRVRRPSHDRVAQLAGGGSGGLYRLRTGTPDVLKMQKLAIWFDKPQGMTYEALYAVLQQPMLHASGCLWQRQMSLGPAWEFCWHTTYEAHIPATWPALQVAISPLWPV